MQFVYLKKFEEKVDICLEIADGVVKNLGMDHEVYDRQEIRENLPDLTESETVITVRSAPTEGNGEEGNSKPSTDLLPGSKVCVDDISVKDEAGRDACVIDVKCSKGLSMTEREGENVCRICHLSSDRRSGPADLIQLGCGCKDDLGTAHRHCAEAWFKIRGNRCCEICSKTAKNITGVGDIRFMAEWNGRETGRSSTSSERRRCWRSQPFCNFLMACMVIAFILPWFFRINIF